jgi:hypothetical protein
LAISGFACALTGRDPSPTPDIEATIQYALEQTVAAQPTDTPTVTPTTSPEPTNTPSPTDTPIPTSTFTPTEETDPFSVEILEDGWSQFTYGEDGFTISIPEGWEHLDLNSSDLDQMLNSFDENESSPLGDLFTSEMMRNLAISGVKFMAIDVSTESLTAGIPTTINILASEMPFDLSLDEMAQVMESQLESIYGQEITLNHEIIELNGSEALKIIYQLEVPDPFGQTHLVEYNQYVVIQNGIQYVITLGSVVELSAENHETFSRIAQSFSLIP